MTERDIKIILVIGFLALAFACGLTIGEKLVIRHQAIYTIEGGYLVDYDGEYYEYYGD